MVIVGRSLPEEYLTHIQALGRTTVILPPDPRLAAPVCSHPDMLLFLYKQTLITDFVYYQEIARTEIDRICRFGNFRLHLTQDAVSNKYPQDIRFNVLHLGDFFFCHATYTSSAIRALAEQEQKILLPTRQGYARCSACPVGNRAMITADPSLANAAKKQGLDVCLIRQGHVLLPGYPHGLIGGCCGTYLDELYFFGDPTLHPNGKEMLTFLYDHGIKPKIIPGLPLFDAGSMFFIPAYNHL
jgi:hypothetical protein